MICLVLCPVAPGNAVRVPAEAAVCAPAAPVTNTHPTAQTSICLLNSISLPKLLTLDFAACRNRETPSRTKSLLGHLQHRSRLLPLVLGNFDEPDDFAHQLQV